MVLGTNEIASAVAVWLAWERYSVILSHDPFPPVIRRGMAFYDALFDDPARVDGIEGKRAETLLEIAAVLSRPGRVVVTRLGLTDLIAFRTPEALIDARLQKHRVTPDLRGNARVTVGLGPKFAVGANCDIAVETRPAKNGSLVESGATDDADGVSRSLGGVGRERLVYSDRTGPWRTAVDIGMQVFKGFVVGHHDGVPVRAPIDGFVRGIARDGAFVPQAVKILEIDPRGREACWAGSDERGRAIAEAALKAILIRAKRAKASLACNRGEEERA